jgi:anti-sigma regulatory factor (Ser/Thr protein kinase)
MPTSIKVYLYSVITVGMTVLIFSFFSINYSSLIIILMLGIVAGILERYIIELPNGTHYSGTLAFTFIALIFLGVNEAIIVEFVIFLVGFVFDKKISIKTIYNVSQYMLCILVAGLFFEWGINSTNLFGWKGILVFLLTIGFHILCNSIMISFIFTKLQGKPYFETIKNILLDNFSIGYLTTIILCFVLAYVFSFNNLILFITITGFAFTCFLALRYAFGLFINLRKTYLTTVEKLSEIKETKLLISRGHSTRVGKMARRLAEELKLSVEEIDAIHYAALFHDMGKLQIGEQIFMKRGPLSIEEEKEYRYHVELGSTMVKEISGLDKTAEYVLYHHERWDGSGFPSKLAEKTIPLGSRIIAVANELDHLLFDPKIKQAKKEFTKLAGNKLDPDLVELSLTIFEELTTGTSQGEGQIEEDIILEKILEPELRQQLQNSALINKLGFNHITYSAGTFKDEKGQEIGLLMEESLRQLIVRVEENQSEAREMIEDVKNGKIYDVYCIPLGSSFQLFLTDVTAILDYERKQEKLVQDLYRDVIFSVTNGKMELLNREDLEKVYQQKFHGSLPIEKKSDVPLCRQMVQEVLTQLAIPGKVSFQILLCTSEVVTNVLKHATSGKMNICYDQGTLQIIVEDSGSGIDLSELPKSTLLPGYSTKVSLGQGFNLLLKMMDKVKLFTSSKGTTIVLEIQLKEHTNINTPQKLA